MSENGGNPHPGMANEKPLLPIKHVLEVHAPDDARVVQLESNDPFGAISKDDLINVRAFTDIAGDYPNQLWRVVQVEHMIYDSLETQLMHQIVVFTTAAPDTSEARTGGGGA